MERRGRVGFDVLMSQGVASKLALTGWKMELEACLLLQAGAGRGRKLEQNREGREAEGERPAGLTERHEEGSGDQREKKSRLEGRSQRVNPLEERREVAVR